MPYLLDTIVVSEAIKARPAPQVVAWLAKQAEGTVYLSVLTLGEVEQGIIRSPNPERAARLGRWVVEELRPDPGHAQPQGRRDAACVHPQPVGRGRALTA